MKLLLTGSPRSGKSTLLRRLLEAFPGNAGGVLVAELVGADGRRCGFELQAVWRPAGGLLQVVERRVLATLRPIFSIQVGRYWVSEEAIALAVQAIDAAMHEGGLVIIDEIGPLQVASPAFQDAVLRCLDGAGHLLAVLGQAQDAFSELVRARPGVRVVEVTRQNRQHLAGGLQAWVTGEHRI